MSSNPSSISSTDLQTCFDVLSKIYSSTDHSVLNSEDASPLRSLLHNVVRKDKSIKRKRLQDERKQKKSLDIQSKNNCLLRAGRAKNLQQLQLEDILIPDGPVLLPSNSSSPPHSRLIQPICCYMCKLKFRTLHFFYDRLCPTCGKFNFDKRNQTTDLSNRIALVTGGRMKIGYRVVLKLLRAKCFVIVTSRFPMDCLNRLKREDDFDQWKDRVHIYGIDFRYSKLIEQFTSMIIEKYPRLDFLINNACQTIQRSPDYYQHLLENERLTHYSLLSQDQQSILEGNRQFYQQFSPHRLTITTPSQSLIPSTTVLDIHQQPIDLRSINSWQLRLADISSQEINDVLTINTLAPFLLNSQLKVLMTEKHPDRESIKFIINVSAMEGSFSRRNKTDRHPHTNAAKAALNMMTRTSANDYKKSNIYMVSVDTGRENCFLKDMKRKSSFLGWINDENPVDRAKKKLLQHDFQTPLDEEDAAARILDPIIDTYQQLSQGKSGIHIPYGCFLKDYRTCDW